MKKIVLKILCKRVRIMDDIYTIGGIIVTLFGVMLFVLLCGYLEYLGE